MFICGGSTLHPQFHCRDMSVPHYIHSSTVEMWRFHITPTVSMYMFGGSTLHPVLMHICGGSTLHPQFHCRDVEIPHYTHSFNVHIWRFHITSSFKTHMWRFHISSAVPLYICESSTLYLQFQCTYADVVQLHCRDVEVPHYIHSSTVEIPHYIHSSAVEMCSTLHPQSYCRDMAIPHYIHCRVSMYMCGCRTVPL